METTFFNEEFVRILRTETDPLKLKTPGDSVTQD